MNHFLKLIVLTLLSLTVLSCKNSNTSDDKTKLFEINNGEFLLDNKPVKIYSGEMHYSRIPRDYWRHRFQMMKSLGLNTVATYAFWNYHNVSPGVWDFESGNRNLAEYIRIAQEEGLYVILRPGPYVCAEWEFGGYPWWLQQNPDLEVRSYNQPFLDSCKIYFQKLADQVRDLQVTHGGPIILIQVENEFGSYISQKKDITPEKHQAYYQAIHQMLKDVGFEVPFFTSDGTWLFEGGAIPGVLPTANGEGDIDNLKASVDKYYPGGPYMVAEYYPGWLDHWGENFIRISPGDNVAQIKKYLENRINFNIYMVHGGTNFGFTSGANFSETFDIQPDITSYDYDAPISEAGWPTEKYKLIREEFKKYSHTEIPDIPDSIPVIQIPPTEPESVGDFFEWVKPLAQVENEHPLSFEDLGQGYGYVLYTCIFKQAVKGKLTIKGLRDYAIVYVNNQKAGELNRINRNYSLNINIPENGRLDILVENMGRINYGSEIVNNEKGIISPVTINGKEIFGNWKMTPVPMNEVPEIKNVKGTIKAGSPAFYRFAFDLEKTGDTFLNMQNWGKGIVFVNGIHIGRYWNIGPQQTLYLPGCWLKTKENEIIVFEQQNTTIQNQLTSLKHPVLEELKTFEAK